MSEPYAYSYTVNLTDAEADWVLSMWGPSARSRNSFHPSVVKLADAVIFQRARPLQVGDRLASYSGEVVMAIDTSEFGVTRVVFQDAKTYTWTMGFTPGTRVDLDGGGVVVVP